MISGISKLFDAIHWASSSKSFNLVNSFDAAIWRTHEACARTRMACGQIEEHTVSGGAMRRKSHQGPLEAPRSTFDPGTASG